LSFGAGMMAFYLKSNWLDLGNPHQNLLMCKTPLYPCEALQCVGVVHFVFFMFSYFYQLDLHNKTCVALANLQRSINKNRAFFDLVVWSLKMDVC
jgi:hypothetical protein